MSGLRVNGLSDLSGNVGIGNSLIVSSAVQFSGYNCNAYSSGGKLTTDSQGRVICQADTDTGVTGSGGVGQVSFWDSSSSISGNTSFYWNNSLMRLGIGNSAPGTTLGVFGSVGIGTSYAFSTLPASAVNGLVVEGNIGIGTSSPTASLYVSGNAGIGWTGVNLSSAMPGLGLSVYGNVGIGTTSPQYPLHVIGNVGIGQSLTVTSLINTTGLNVSGTSSLGTAYTNTLVSSGNVSIGSSLTVTSAAALSTLNVTGISNLVGNVGIGNSLIVNNLSYLMSGLRVNGYSDLSGNVGIGSSLIVGSAVQFSGYNCNAYSSGGKLTTDSQGRVICQADTDTGVTGSGGVGQVSFWDSSSSISGNTSVY